jgi:hypothetical protein
MDRPKRQMDLGLFRRMIDQAAAMGIPDLVPNGYGEILLIKNLEDYLGYITSRTHRFRTIINTNGHLMSDEKIDLLLRSRVHLLNITIDGATAETAQSVRVGLSTERIEDNIRRLLSLRKARGLTRPKVRVGMVLIPENRHEVGRFRDKWTGVADYVGFGWFSTRLGSIDLQEPGVDAGETDGNTPPEKHPCLLPFRELNVWSDGKAVLCCEDWNEEYVVGDLRTQTLQEVWRGAVLRHVRRLHMQLKGDQIPLCAKCNAWKKPSVTARLWA